MIKLSTEIDDAVMRALLALRPEMIAFSTQGGNRFGDIVWGDTVPVTLDEINSILLEVENAMNMDQLRNQRDIALAASDWTQMPDVSLADQASWATYRQALRDLPTTVADPANPVWPSPPA